MTQAIRIIGIDPGLQACGWGVIAVEGQRHVFLGAGTILTKAADPLSGRLKAIHDALGAVFAYWQPRESAVESTFINRDGTATLKLGQARGVAMLAPALHDVPVAEYAPNQIKKAVAGAGHADKGQIRAMVKLFLPRADIGSEHEADALAIALCHAFHRGGSAATLGARMTVSA
jgi:crossover junction endodeoxyribonuclease RuvC